MLRKYQTTIVGIALLFCAQSAQAVPVPVEYDFGIIGAGTYQRTAVLPDTAPNVLWFQFELIGPANVSLDTNGSTFVEPDLDDDTLLALYNSSGTILGDNEDCVSGPPFYSCLNRTLAGGIFYAGVTNHEGSFGDNFTVTTTDGTGNITLNLSVSAVPVPAAVWLFGTALIVFIGMSRRTNVKA